MFARTGRRASKVGDNGCLLLPLSMKPGVLCYSNLCKESTSTHRLNVAKRFFVATIAL